MAVQVRPSGFLTYKDRDDATGDTENLRAGREKLTTQGYTGKMSSKAVAKVKKYATNWVTALNAQGGDAFAPLEAQAARLRFVTLTLPASQQHSDNELKRVFNSWFMLVLKRRYDVENYIWRAETQKRGGLHFHVLIDRPVPHKELRAIWNDCLTSLGYIARYKHNQEAWHKEGFKVRRELFGHWNAAAQLKAYKTGCKEGWCNPNTTDIHALENVKNVVAYVVKYVSKNSSSRAVEGRLWGCSDAIRELERFTVQEDSNLMQLLTKAVEDEECKITVGDGWSFYTCDTRSMLELWCPGLSNLFMSHWQAQGAKLAGLAYIPATPPTHPPPC